MTVALAALPETFLATANARAEDFARNSRSKATRRAYKSDWADFEGWCARHHFDALPASPHTLTLYLSDQADRHKIATIRRRLVAISDAHRQRGLDTPTSHPVVRAVVRGIANVIGSAQSKKAALTDDLLRGALLEAGDGLKAMRDRAILLLGFAAALRRSEIAALTIEDLRFEREGVVLRIRRSKTDQAGEGEEIGVPSVDVASLCPVRALRAWIDAAGISGGPVFRSFTMRGVLQARAIAGADVARLVQRVTRKAAIAGDFGAHSLRAGFVTSAARKGVSEVAIQGVTRHRSVAILRGYVRRATVFEGAPLRSIFG